MGEAAARLLVERSADFSLPRRQVILEPKLVVRASSGPLRAKAPDLSPRGRGRLAQRAG